MVETSESWSLCSFFFFAWVASWLVCVLLVGGGIVGDCKSELELAVGGRMYIAGALYFKEPEVSEYLSSVLLVGRRPSLVCTGNLTIFLLKKKRKRAKISQDRPCLSVLHHRIDGIPDTMLNEF